MSERQRLLKELKVLRLEKELKRRETSDTQVRDTDGGIDPLNPVGGNLVGEAGQMAKDIVTVAPQGLALGLADDAMDLAGFPEAAESYRGAVRGARESSPYATGVTEMVMPNPLNKFKFLSKLWKLPLYAATGGAIGYGESEGDTEQKASSGLVGAGLGVGMGLIGKVAKKLVADPESIIASKMGTKPKTIKSESPRFSHPKETIKKRVKPLWDKGLFRGSKADYNEVTGKWERPKTATKMGNLGNPDDSEILERLGDAVEKENAKADRLVRKFSPAAESTSPVIERGVKSTKTGLAGEQIDELLPPKYTSVPPQGIHTSESLKSEFSQNLTALRAKLHTKFPKDGQVKKINALIDEELKTLDTEFGFTVSEMHNRKKTLYAKLDKSYDLTSSEDALPAAVDKEMARFYKTITNKEVEGLEEVNKRLSNIYGADKDLQSKLITDELSADQVPHMYGGLAHMASQAGSAIADPTRIPRAKVGMGLSKLEEYLQGKEANLPEMLQGTIRPLQKMGPQMLRNTREPQSVGADSMGIEPQNIEEVITQMRFPRSTEGVLENREAFLQKVKLSDAENYDAVKTILESSPQEIQAVLPTLTKTMPYLFEYDEYGRFDGKVPQEMRPATVKKIWDMPFSNTEKTALIDIMNRTGDLDL